MKQAPILVTGAPRSSTTFLGNMLALPGSLLYVDEPFNVQTGIEGIHEAFPSPVRKGGDAALDELYGPVIERLLAGKARFKPSELRPGAKGSLKKLARNTLVSREHVAYKLQSRNPLKARYLIKDPMVFSLSEYLHRRFGMQVVVIMRHPLPVVASYKRLSWHYAVETELLPWAVSVSPDLKKAVDKIDLKHMSEVERWSLLWLAVYGVLGEFIKRNPDMMFVTHEELSANPHETLEKLYRKLGLDYTARIRQKVDEYTNASNPSSAGDQVHVLRRNSAQVNQNWKKILTPEEVRVIRNITGPFVNRFYPDSSWE